MKYEVSVVKLEDGKDYMVVRDIMIEKNRYCLLSDINHAENVCVRKVASIQGEDSFIYLDDEEELQMVMAHLLQEAN